MIGDLTDLYEFTSKWLESIGIDDWVVQIIMLIIGTVIILAITIYYGYKIISWIRLKIKQRYLRKDLHPFFTGPEIDKATRYYIQTKYQDTAPSQAEEPGRTFIDSPKAKLIRMFLKVAFKRDDNRFYLILADVGMGKTTFMINLYLRYKRQWTWGKPKYNIRLLPLGNPHTLAEIDSIKDQENTILLLDALDEDTLAVQDYKKRLSEILDHVWRFREVVITSRTQFFPSRAEEPHETGFFKHGTDGGEFYFRKAYISVFDDWDIIWYLLKRYNLFNPINWRRLKRAWRIVKKSPNLMVRPMLLSNIKVLSERKKTYDYAFQIYETLIDEWIDREARKPGIKEKYGSKENFKGKLYHFSQKLAINLYENREKRGGLFINMNEVLPAAELQLSDIEEDVKKTIKESEWRGRSLLNRDAEGNYKFSHKSILEYFLAKEAMENKDFFHNLRLSGMEAANNFLLDMLFEKEIESWQQQKIRMSRKDLFRSIINDPFLGHQAWHNLGFAYSKKEEYDKAIECYQKSISIKKDDPDAWHNLGSTYIYKEDYDKAIECYQKAISIKKDDPNTWIGLGLAYSNKEDYDKAIEYYQKAISIKKDYHHAWHNLGNAYLDKEDYDKAIECYQTAISIKKEYYYAWGGLGNAYDNKEDYDKAIECYQKAISIKKDYHVAWDNLGDAYRNKEDYDKAIECYQKAISIKKDDHHAWNGLGIAFHNKEDYDKAIECFQKAIEINPKFLVAAYLQGVTWRFKEDFNKAIECFQYIISIDPNIYLAFYQMGNAYADKGEFDQAIQAYQQAIAIKPDYHEAFYNMGSAYYNKKEYDQAIMCYQQAIAIKPDDHEVFYNMGIAYDDKGDYNQAIECYQKAISIKKDYQVAWNNLGDAYRNKEDYDKAIEAYQQAISIKPDDSDYLLSLAGCLFISGRINESVPLFQKAIECGDLYGAYIGLGFVNLCSKNIDAAIEYFNIALSNSAEDAHFWEDMQETFKYLTQYGITEAQYQQVLAQIREASLS